MQTSHTCIYISAHWNNSLPIPGEFQLLFLCLAVGLCCHIGNPQEGNKSFHLEFAALLKGAGVRLGGGNSSSCRTFTKIRWKRSQKAHPARWEKVMPVWQSREGRWILSTNPAAGSAEERENLEQFLPLPPSLLFALQTLIQHQMWFKILSVSTPVQSHKATTSFIPLTCACCSELLQGCSQRSQQFIPCFVLRSDRAAEEEFLPRAKPCLSGTAKPGTALGQAGCSGNVEQGIWALVPGSAGEIRAATPADPKKVKKQPQFSSMEESPSNEMLHGVNLSLLMVLLCLLMALCMGTCHYEWQTWQANLSARKFSSN